MFTEKQPKDGEVVLTCSHHEATTTFHFFHFPVPIPFVRPNSTQGSANWMVICESCFLLHPQNPEAVIVGDSIWVGDESLIEEREEN